MQQDVSVLEQVPAPADPSFEDIKKFLKEVLRGISSALKKLNCRFTSIEGKLNGLECTVEMFQQEIVNVRPKVLGVETKSAEINDLFGR